jgi:hypothetical protein
MTSKHITNCPNCFETIKKNGSYENHIFKCQRTNEAFTSTGPSNKQLYEIIVCLTEKYNKVQTEVDNLKKHFQIKNKKLDILLWLNKQQVPSNNWNEYIENININIDDLHYIFENNLVDGILQILVDRIEQDNIECIKCYEQKKNILYVYNNYDTDNNSDINHNNVNKWMEIPKDEFKNGMNKIYSKCLQTFDVYKNENEEKMKTDSDFQDQYTKNFMKLINTKPSFDVLCVRIKNKLYTEIKESFSSITEFEI